ncbi:MAG TPA: histidinol-phosphatase HisJ family protein [Spirochaetota bacterium]|nr:histidinol-phosphatase HisJ family protein [Spirochaetota bacterium]
MIDYHVHTYLCDHASGTPGDYIEKALEARLFEIGFSDHAPLPEHLRNDITMEPEETEIYCSMLEGIKDKYPIAVKIGFEVDYPLHPTFDTQYFHDNRIDYMIGSCHFIDGWAFDHPLFVDEYNKRDINQVYRDYYNIVFDMVNSGLFDIIGHFDLVKKFGYRATVDLTDHILPIVKLAGKQATAIEINTSGLRKPVKEIYPSYDIIKLMFENNVPITLGSDAHAPEEVAYSFYDTLPLIKRAGYKKIVGYNKRKQYAIVL